MFNILFAVCVISINAKIINILWELICKDFHFTCCNIISLQNILTTNNQILLPINSRYVSDFFYCLYSLNLLTWNIFVCSMLFSQEKNTFFVSKVLISIYHSAQTFFFLTCFFWINAKFVIFILSSGYGVLA